MVQQVQQVTVPCIQGVTGFGLRNKLGNLDSSLNGEAWPMASDAFQLVECVGGKVTLSTMGTHYKGYIFNDEEVCALPYGFDDPADARSFCSTHVTDHLLCSSFHRA